MEINNIVQIITLINTLLITLFGGGSLVRTIWLRKQKNKDDALAITLEAAQSQNKDYWEMQRKEKEHNITKRFSI